MERPNSYKHKLSNLTYKETENLNRLITSEKIYLDHYKPYNKKNTPGPDGFTDEFYKTFKN